jgi:hypothetical protein
MSPRGYASVLERFVHCHSFDSGCYGGGSVDMTGVECFSTKGWWYLSSSAACIFRPRRVVISAHTLMGLQTSRTENKASIILVDSHRSLFGARIVIEKDAMLSVESVAWMSNLKMSFSPILLVTIRFSKIRCLCQ